MNEVEDVDNEEKLKLLSLKGFLNSKDDNGKFSIDPKILRTYAEDLISDRTEAILNDNSAYLSLFLKTLVDKKLINSVEIEEYESLTIDKLIELSEIPLKLFYDKENRKVCFKNFEDDTVFIDVEINPIESRGNIVHLLPPITFDVTYKGDINKAKEASAAYKVFILNSVYSNAWGQEIYTIIKEYDFEKMKSKISEDYSFSVLLKEIQDSTDAVARLILSACNIKITEARTKKEQKLYSSLSKTEASELSKLKHEIASMRLEYEKEVAKGETRAEKTVLRERLQTRIDDKISSSPIFIIYKILHTNSLDVETEARIYIAKAARAFSKDIEASELLSGHVLDSSSIRRIQSKLKQKGMKEYVAEYKMRKLEAFRKKEPFGDFEKKLDLIP